MRYNLSSIMRAAWKFFRKGISSFSLALRMAWANAKTQNAAKATAEITEETPPGTAGRSWAMKLSMRARPCIRLP